MSVNVGELTNSELEDLLHMIADEIRLRRMQTADDGQATENHLCDRGYGHGNWPMPNLVPFYNTVTIGSGRTATERKTK